MNISGRNVITTAGLFALILILCLAQICIAKTNGAKSTHAKTRETKKTGVKPATSSETFVTLQERLIKDGFSPGQVRQVYENAPELLLKTVAQTFHIRESKLNYNQFLAPSAIGKAQDFIARHQHTLVQAEEMYGVDKCVIAAILLVETHFGSYTGKTPTLGVLSSFAVMADENYRDKVWEMLSREDKERWDRTAFDTKLIARSQWAYRELCALLELDSSRKAKVEGIRGSVMGAVGWPQFLPSSQLRYGVDGDKDGIIDLFTPADAIFSVANYFRAYGWCQAKTQDEKENVIYQYNHSKPYVNAVLGVASLLK